MCTYKFNFNELLCNNIQIYYPIEIFACFIDLRMFNKKFEDKVLKVIGLLLKCGQYGQKRHGYVKSNINKM